MTYVCNVQMENHLQLSPTISLIDKRTNGMCVREAVHFEIVIKFWWSPPPNNNHCYELTHPCVHQTPEPDAAENAVAEGDAFEQIAAHEKDVDRDDAPLPISVDDGMSLHST